MEALFVKEGALTRVIVDVNLVELVDATHVSLECEGGAHVAHALLLRAHIAFNDRTHGHVRAIVDRELLQLPALILLECTSTHLFGRVTNQVFIQSRCLLGAGETASLRGVPCEALVFDVHHFLSSSLFWLNLINVDRISGWRGFGVLGRGSVR